MTNKEIRQLLISESKEMIKNDWNYKKGVSKTSEAIDLLIKKIGGYSIFIKEFEKNSDVFENIEDMLLEDLRIDVAKTTCSIYISLFNERVRISDHQDSVSDRFKSQALAGAVSEKLFVK